MKTKEFENAALALFPKDTLAFFNDGNQYGFNNYIEKELNKIGYSVNLTPEIIKQANINHIDLLLTHHNVWEDYFELRDDCLRLLEEYGIIHFFNHLPLDSMPFGPTGTLANDLDLKVIDKISKIDKYAFGVVGELEEPITLLLLTEKLEKIFNHKVRIWNNNNRLVKRIGIVAGSGSDIESLFEANTLKSDVYITGEKKLKTLLYAKHIGLTIILGSHTFTELGGIRQYAKLINNEISDVEVIELKDEFLE